MRKSRSLNNLVSQSAQQGYSLFIVLMIMIVIALLVVTAVQSYNTEQRISTNEADRKLAFSLAEAALQRGENKIIDFENKVITFTADCKNGQIDSEGSFDGLCITAGIEEPDEINSSIKFTGTCTNKDESKGIKCITPAWERVEKSCNDKLCIDTNGQEIKDTNVENVSKNPRYIIEYISTDTSQGSTVYRVTAKAWGKNNNTVVMLQSYVVNE